MKHEPSVDLFEPVTHTDHSIGAPDVPLTVVEYGDFECPNCKQAAPVVRLLLDRFAGGIRVVYRHFPLEEVHPHAMLAAEAAEAAGAQGMFWKMHDLLFAHQSHLKPQQLHAYASELELDLERFDYDMQEHTFLQRVREHQESGHRSGVRVTPAFFLNGKLHDVSFGLQSLETEVERLLKPASTR